MLVLRLEHAGMLAQSVEVARGVHGSQALVALPPVGCNDAEAQAAWGRAGLRVKSLLVTRDARHCSR